MSRHSWACAAASGIAIGAGLLVAAPAQAQTSPSQPAGVSLTPLPLINGGTGGFATAINGDGSVVAGYVDTDEDRFFTIWTNRAPTTYTLPLGFADNTRFQISADGRTVVGTGYLYFDGYAWIWTPERGQRIIPDISPNEAIYGPGAISADGSTVAVSSLYGTRRIGTDGRFLGGTGPTGGGNAYLWTEAGGFRSIGHLTSDPKEDIAITALSGDASTAAGNARRCTVCTGTNPLYDIFTPFVWKDGAGFTVLPHLSNHPTPSSSNPLGWAISDVASISRDGSTVVGSSFGSDGRNQAVFWRSGQINLLGFVNPGDEGTAALFANSNGGVIIGQGFDQNAEYQWRWTSTTGMQDIRSILANSGLDLGTYRINRLEGLSDDGRIILGNGYDSAVTDERSPFLIQLAQITRTQLIVLVQLPGQTLQSIVNQSFSTQVTGTLNGQAVLSRSVADTIDSSSGMLALAAVRDGLSVGGLRRVTIGAPYLVSNTTTVASSNSSTTNVVTGTTTTTATIDTFGPATVTTGDLGTCATAAASTALPTGCSRPGTPVAVDVGVLNTNIYTNTIQSITPTTTVTVNQLISARWQIDALGGNQFGTVHALVGPAAFARGDQLATLLLSRGGGGNANSQQARAGGAGGRVSRLSSDSRLSVFGGYHNERASVDPDPTIPVAGVKGSSDGFTFGLELPFGDGARVGLAIDHGKSRFRVTDPTFPETLNQSLTQLAAYGGWHTGRLSLAGSAALGFGEANTVIATPTGPASASRNVTAWSLGAEGRYAFPLGNGEIGAAAGVHYTAANLQAFTETGGSTPLVGLDKTVRRIRGYAGLDASLPIALGQNTRMIPRVYARAAHDGGDSPGSADVIFASAPGGPTLTAYGPRVGDWTAEMGGGVELEVGGGWSIWGVYDAQVRDRASIRSMQAGASIRF